MISGLKGRRARPLHQRGGERRNPALAQARDLIPQPLKNNIGRLLLDPELPYFQSSARSCGSYPIVSRA